ncbi:MAG: SGNH/GDSL hydrolase family protein [Mariniblastus sp.]|nr:SGNH/GDSL hydrolase family protein [Mariniblastus sp.]
MTNVLKKFEREWGRRLWLVLGCMVLGYASPLLGAPQESAWERTDHWNGFVRRHFKVGAQAAYVVLPEKPAEGRPWVWRARFPDYHPEIDIDLLKRGYHIGYVDVAGMFGGPQALKIGTVFYREARRRVDLAERVTLEGVSRGGLFVYQWAAQNPDKVANIFCDTPVCDIRSWPGGKGLGVGAEKEWRQCLAAYEITEEPVPESIASMIRHADVIAAAGIPVLHVVTENDKIVPPAENTYVLSKRFAELWHPMKIISIERGTAQSNGHHFAHQDIGPIVDFISNCDCSAAPLEMFKKAKRIVFLGDSISYSGEYIVRLETALRALGRVDVQQFINVGLPSETVSGLSEQGHAGGRFPRPDLAERLARVLTVAQPDLVVACYGINCGIYQPFDVSRFEKYQVGIQRLKSDVEATGAQLLLITPPTFDDQRGGKSFSYDMVMQHYSNWLVAQRAQGWAVLDLHKAMAGELKKRRLKDPSFTLQPDAVHPNPAGHQWIAEALLDGLLMSGEGSSKEPVEKLIVEEDLLNLIRQRSHLWRDAYLSETGHMRPGIREGLPLREAQKKSEMLTKRINDLLDQARQHEVP